MKRLWVTGFGVLLGLAFLLATIAWNGQEDASRREAARQWETHTREVLLAASQMLSLLQDAETGQRGYIITALPSFLEPYDSGRASALSSVDRLATLTRDNASQQARITDLREVTLAKLADLEATVALVRTGNRQAAIAIVTTERGKMLMDKARAVIAAIMAEENRLLDIRHEAWRSAGADNRRMTLYLDGAGVLTLLYALAAGILAFRGAVRAQTVQGTKASEQRLRLFIDHAPASIAMFDKGMRYLAVNRRYLQDYGLQEADPATLIGRSHYEFFPDIPERWRAIHRRVLAGETIAQEDDPFPRTDGRMDWVHWEMLPWRQADGTVGGAILYSELVTSRKQAALQRALMLELAERQQVAPREAVGAAVTLLGSFLRASRAGYAEVDATSQSLVVVEEYNPDGVAPITDAPLVDSFGFLILEDLRAGRSVTVTDVLADPRTRELGASTIGGAARALLIVPKAADRQVQALFYLCDDSPRHWTPDELRLANDVAARTCSVVEQVRANDAVERVAEEFRALADGIPTLCWMARPDGHIYWYNQRWYDYTGTVPADMEGWGWQSVHDPETLPAVMLRWQASLGTGAPFEMTFPLRRADGVFRPFMTRIAPVVGPDGQVQRWLGINTDVAEVVEREIELRQSAADLRASETRLQVIFDTVPIGLVIGEAPNGKPVAGNRQAEAIFRHPTLCSPDVAHDHEWVAFHPDGRPVVGDEHPLLRALAGEERPELKVLYQRGDGTTGWVHLIAAPIRTGDVVTAAVVAALDIDNETRALETLSEVRDSLELRVAKEVQDREATHARLVQAEKLTALGQLAGGVAHDFNNVLQTVSGGVGLIREHATDVVAVKRFSAMVEEAARRGASVTHRLLAFARRDELRAESIDVEALLGDLHEVLVHTLGSSFTIKAEAAPGLAPVLADRGQLQTALVNLATNARDAMPDGGKISILADAETVSDDGDALGLAPGAYVRFRIEDTGSGMGPDALRRCMEPFFTTKEQGRGTGLGLPMARGFVEQSGGALSVDSQPGRGTTVTLRLPVGAVKACQSTPDNIAEHTASAHQRIMVVDDEALVREMLAQQLVDRGYDVVQAERGDMALALLDAGEPVDLLLSDLTMPGMNGIALIHAAQLRNPRLPAILLTGYAGDAAKLAVGGAGSGLFSLLRKPVAAAQLTDRVANLLEAALVE